MRPTLAIITMVTVLAGPVSAAESPWFETDGVRLKLLTDDHADANGELRGVLKVDLDTGWKTYWMDPGDAGVPPQIGIGKSTNVSGAEIQFPAPKRFDEGSTHWAGYGAPVDLPVTFSVKDPAMFTAIDADVFIGVCKDVCIPVQAMLSVTPDPQADTNPASTEIATAFSNLPAAASAAMGVTAFRLDGEMIRSDASMPGGGLPTDLFVVAPSGWLLEAPKPNSSGGFDIHIAGRPKGGEVPALLRYTLVVGDQAVTGTTELR